MRLSCSVAKIVNLLKVEVAREHLTAAKAAIMKQCSAAFGDYED
jgi:hypothetical protein